MTEPAPIVPATAEPFTPRGVAAFARAPLGRLFLTQFIIAILVGGVMVWFLHATIFPVVQTAINHLPDTGEIRSGRLQWPPGSPQLLAESRCLAFVVDPQHAGNIKTTADVQLEFGAKTVRSSGLLGYVEADYPAAGNYPFNRTELGPRWGAWRAEVLFFAFALTVIGLLVIWSVLATFYFPPVWLLAHFTGRDLNFRQSWRLSGAALMPGALLMAAAILLYGSGFLDLIALGFIFGAHLVLSWIYLFISLLFVPRIPAAAPPANPFKP